MDDPCEWVMAESSASHPMETTLLYSRRYWDGTKRKLTRCAVCCGWIGWVDGIGLGWIGDQRQEAASKSKRHSPLLPVSPQAPSSSNPLTHGPDRVVGSQRGPELGVQHRGHRGRVPLHDCDSGEEQPRADGGVDELVQRRLGQHRAGGGGAVGVDLGLLRLVSSGVWRRVCG